MIAALSSQGEVLDGVLERVGDLRARRPVVLFDIDDTLLYTSRRNLRIIHEFARLLKAEDREHHDWRYLMSVDTQDIRYSVTETAKVAGVHASHVLAELRDYWFKRFFTNEYLLEDKPIPGAPEYCRATVEAGALPLYLTGRDEGMREGTLKVLERHGFPMPGQGAELILKPTFETPDFEFKVEALRRVAAFGPVAGGFENEPAHINLFHETFPEGRMVFVESKHSGKPIVPLPGVARVRDYRRS